MEAATLCILKFLDCKLQPMLSPGLVGLRVYPRHNLLNLRLICLHRVEWNIFEYGAEACGILQHP
ncbi:MAG: hypothetical protein ACPLKQ_08745 [Candidatus Bathyarchaeales archaeon]